MDSETMLFWNAHGLNGRAHHAVVAELISQE
jgi:hypothetical protein